MATQKWHYASVGISWIIVRKCQMFLVAVVSDITRDVTGLFKECRMEWCPY